MNAFSDEQIREEEKMSQAHMDARKADLESWRKTLIHHFDKRSFKQHGTGTTLTGKKHDKGKLRWELLDLKLIEPVVDVLTYGAEKYEGDSWKYVPNGKNRYYAALMRHITEWQSGKKIDEESGKRHLWMAMCNLYFLIWFDSKG